MALFGLVFFVVALVLIGIGIAIGLVGCGIAAVMIGAGTVSLSVVVGIRSGRAASGIRAFLLQCGILAGIPAGVVCALLAHSLFEAYGSQWPVLVYGAIGGAFSGMFIALLFDFITQRLHGWASARFLSSRRLPDAALPDHSVE